eukprot:26908-Chlamydomonas_euryale.AAC.1
MSGTNTLGHARVATCIHHFATAGTNFCMPVQPSATLEEANTVPLSARQPGSQGSSAGRQGRREGS